jgi:hypothetical protein
MRALLGGLGAALALAGCAQPAPRSEDTAASPSTAEGSAYAGDAAWLCRPGRRDACSSAELDAVRLDARGGRTPAPFQPAGAPPIDCFYVYPTVSADPTPVSDMTPGPEEARTAASQAARFASRCRVFAPVYRQITLAGLRSAMGGGVAVDWSEPYGDVRAAWRDYLRRDNGGRGVVLIGHSQGAILLSRLLAEEIETNPAQKRLLVSAILAGHPGLAVPEGQDVGGDFKTTPLCRARDQTGCAVVFASYAATDPATRRFFGKVEGAGRRRPASIRPRPAGARPRFGPICGRRVQRRRAGPIWSSRSSSRPNASPTPEARSCACRPCRVPARRCCNPSWPGAPCFPDGDCTSWT